MQNVISEAFQKVNNSNKIGKNNNSNYRHNYHLLNISVAFKYIKRAEAGKRREKVWAILFQTQTYKEQLFSLLPPLSHSVFQQEHFIQNHP